MVELDEAADAARFTDDDAGAVVDEEMGADGRAGMDVDARAGMRPFGHHAGDDRCAFAIEPMREALDGDGLDEGKGKNDLFVTNRRRVAVESRLDVVLEQFPHNRQSAGELVE